MQKLLSFADLKAKGHPLGKIQTWRLVREGKFPAPIKIGSKSVWPDNEYAQYLAGLIARRDGEAA
jgi:predicted DNA-binding transcriptional regulator AlpA